jgi:hypothetical protein
MGSAPIRRITQCYAREGRLYVGIGFNYRADVIVLEADAT